MVLKAVTLRVMPESPEQDLQAIQKNVEEFVNKEEGKVSKVEEEPVAFGLKALIIFLGWPEEKDTEPLEEEVQKIQGVSSAQVTDIRRAFG